MSSSPSILILNPERGNPVKIPLPVPSKIKCGARSCRGSKTFGQWSGPHRHLEFYRHTTNIHANLEIADPVFFCSRCKEEFSSFHAGGRHERKCKVDLPATNSTINNSTSTRRSSRSFLRAETSIVADRSVPFPVARIDGGKFILLYPGAPTQCPRCEWVTLDTMCGAMGSMHRPELDLDSKPTTASANKNTKPELHRHQQQAPRGRSS